MKYTPLAVATRGGHPESVHTGSIVVADVTGAITATIGDPKRFTYFRSSAKPFQAIPVVESGAADAFGLTPAELALCCASHSGQQSHQDQVAAFLDKLGMSADTLRCGISLPYNELAHAEVIDGKVAPSPLQCDCSGKHSGMLSVCKHLGYPTDSYLSDDHPLQKTIKSIIAAVCRVDENEIEIARDGCSLPTFGMTVDRFAVAFATLASPADAPDGAGAQWSVELDRLRAAMVTHPENVAGDGELVTDLMRIGGGEIVAKSGAEGLICFGIPAQRLGVAVRIDDGSFRAHPAVIIELLRKLDALPEARISELEELYPPHIRTHNGWHVGDLTAAFDLPA